ncbi:MAG: hypothetical protein PF518_13515 [Spirochaetaceae bacterium]|jgi:hypothetical protein|nr:hypothetical protein [Spirochaetaceae bacterium]
MNKNLSISGLFFFLPLLLFCQIVSEPLVFNRENWNVSIEKFSGELSPSNQYLKSSLSNIIKRELISSDMHILSFKEKIRYKNTLIEKKRKDIISSLSQSYIKKDNLLFEPRTIKLEIDNLNKELDTFKKNLIELSTYDLSIIKTAEMLPVQWIGPNDNEDLQKADQYSQSVIIDFYDLDFLISGSIKEIDDYFLIEVYGFDPVSDDRILIYSNVGTVDELENLAFEAANELRSIVLGRPWSILHVEMDQEDALIYSDGVLIGIGSADINTIEPGTVFLEAMGSDNSYWSNEIELMALQENSITGKLSQSEINFLTLQTEPSDADVYIGARWAGKSPLNIPRYKDRNIWVSIKLDGYYDKSFEVSTKSPEDLFFELEEEEMSRMENFEIKKKQFYSALGLFSISVAAPVIMGGVFSNYANRQNAYVLEFLQTSDPSYSDLAMEMEKNYYISYGTFWGTIGISTGLLVNVFVKLSRYIKAAEALTE